MMALFFPISGMLVDRFGPRPVLMVGYVLIGATLASMGYLQGSYAALVVTYLMLGVAGTLPTGVAYARAITGNFSRRRGLALGLCLGVGGGLGAALIPPLCAYLIGTFGWRQAYILLGLLPVVIGLPSAFLLPRQTAARTSSEEFGASAVSRRVVLGDPSFWLLLLIAFIANAAVSGVVAHLVALLGDRGIARDTASMILSVVAIGTVVGQTASGGLLDRVATPKAGLPLFGSILLGIILLNMSTSQTTVLLSVALIGLGTGAEYAFFSYVISRMFDFRHFSTIYGSVFAASAFASGLGPLLMGTVYVQTGSYQIALIGFIAALIVCMIATLRLRGYREAFDSPTPQQPGARSLS